MNQLQFWFAPEMEKKWTGPDFQTLAVQEIEICTDLQCLWTICTELHSTAKLRACLQSSVIICDCLLISPKSTLILCQFHQNLWEKSGFADVLTVLF